MGEIVQKGKPDPASTGLLIYTKGVIRKDFGQETLYILVSAKRST